MVVEVVCLGALGVPVMLAGAVGSMVARWGRDGREIEALSPNRPDRPALGVVTADALGDLPLVAPGRAGYGTATYLLIEAARERRAATGIRPAPVSARGTRAA